MSYQTNFITGYDIPLPVIPDKLRSAVAPVSNGQDSVRHYHHHSMMMHKQRKFAFFSASNIDGNSWAPIERTGSFKKDVQLSPDFQLGDELYDAIRGRGRKNDFDEGHLTSFQEILWGSPEDMTQAGQDTFYFTNCVPQHSLLNKGAWKSLEQYMTKTAADNNDLKIAVMTGPVLSGKDPYFIKSINGTFVQIPCTFWKVIYYRNRNGLNAVGFMMSHRDLLLQEGTVTFDKGLVEEKAVVEEEPDVFMEFPKSTTYQVKVEQVQQATGLNFRLSGVNLPYQKKDSTEVVYKRIEIKDKRLEDFSFQKAPLDFQLEGLTMG